MVVVVLALILVASPGLAAGGGGEGSTSFNLIGTITAVTCPIEEDGDITVEKTWPGTGEVEVVLDQGTLFKECTEIQGEGDNIPCSLLETLHQQGIDLEVRIVGDRDGTLTARRVILLPQE